MNKKNILLASLCLKVSCALAMELSTFQKALPSLQEVAATNHLLTLDMYANAVQYLKSPSIPTDETFEKRLKKHLLVQSLWLEEKGFLRDLQAVYQGEKSLQHARAAIEKNYAYQNFVRTNALTTQKILMANLLQAYKDCAQAK